MLVVIGIIGILLSLVLLVGRGALTDAKVKDTRVMLAQLNTAIQAFADANPYKSVAKAKTRYGPYPPDSILAFEPNPPASVKVPYLLSGGGRFAKIGANGPYLDDFDPADSDNPDYVKFGSVKALVFFLRSQSASREIYDAIPDRFKRTADSNIEFFDLNANNSFDPTVDKEVQYLVDGWGQGIEYYSVRVDDGDGATSHSWVGFRLVQANKNLPVLVSYGPDGETQIKQNQTLEGQYNLSDGQTPVFADPDIGGPLNEDNVYLDDSLREKMKKIEKD